MSNSTKKKSFFFLTLKFHLIIGQKDKEREGEKPLKKVISERFGILVYVNNSFS